MRIAYRANKEGLILVTDAISPLGLEDGEHHIGQLRVRIQDGMARIAGTDTLCGSIASMDECVRIFKKSTGKIKHFTSLLEITAQECFCLDCSTVFAIEAATLHPAKCLGLEKVKGTLSYGADADFVMLNDNLTVRSTWISGNQVYSNAF